MFIVYVSLFILSLEEGIYYNTEYETVNPKKKPVSYNSIFINRCEFIIMENLIENLKIITYAHILYLEFENCIKFTVEK